jgi:glucose/mannose-6-phosphate isomerase
VTAGGKLFELAQANSLPVYKIDPVYNPSGQPRMAVGYSVFGELVLASKVGLLKIDQSEVDTVVKTMEAVVNANKDEIDVKNNPAKQLAEKIKDKQVIFAAGGHLAGPGHTLKNQMNENAKHLSHRHDLPELNHHLMEGLRFPESNPQSVMFWFISSNLYSDRLKQRVQLTQEVVAKNNIDAFTSTATAPTKLSQAFELIQFGAFVNFYLSQLHGIDPAPIPWVDYFKSHLV